MLYSLKYKHMSARASAPETRIIHVSKCVISVWPIAIPSAMIVFIVNTILIQCSIELHFVYQISEVLYDMHIQVTERIRNYNISMGNLTPLVIAD